MVTVGVLEARTTLTPYTAITAIAIAAARRVYVLPFIGFDHA
jgi:hypothetical protein